MNRTGAAAPDAPTHAPSRLRRILWTGLAVCVGTAALLLAVAAHRLPWFPGDVQITRSVQAVDAPALALALGALNALGFPPLVGIVYGAIVGVIFLAGSRWEAAAAGFTALGGAGINALVKHVVERPRPSSLLVDVDRLHDPNTSFPAGHVLNFTAFAGFLCCLVYLRMRPTWRRSALIALLLAMIALMGIARIDSGEHWPSDVLGGYLLGTLWLTVTVLLYEWGRRRFPALRREAAAGASRHALVIALAILSPSAPAGAAHAAPDPSDSLGASSGVPWNPPRALAPRRGWEQAVLLPGRIVSLPLSGLGWLADGVFLRLEQSPRFAGGTASPQARRARTIALGTPRMGDRTGLGGAVEVGMDILHGTFGSRVSAEYTGTLNRYNRTLLTWTGRPLSLQYGYEWRPQDRFYGVGNRTREDGVSDYASQGEFLRGGLAWDSNREHDPARSRSALALWGGPRSQVTLAGRESGTASYERRFPELGAVTLNRRVENLVYGASLLHDGRSGAPHWSRGWRALISAERFDAPVRALALGSGSGDGARFTRYQAEVEAGLSFRRDPRTVRVLLRVADLQAGSNRDRLLISDLSMLGGHAGLGGYSPGRFHDLDLLLTRVTYVFPLMRRLETDLHAEWGAVYPDVWHGPRFNTLHHSFGFALRARNDHAPSASIGFDFSPEAARLRFSIGGVE
jgi:membrane-associated phospholipid phosphatase